MALYPTKSPLLASASLPSPTAVARRLLGPSLPFVSPERKDADFPFGSGSCRTATRPLLHHALPPSEPKLARFPYWKPGAPNPVYGKRPSPSRVKGLLRQQAPPPVSLVCAGLRAPFPRWCKAKAFSSSADRGGPGCVATLPTPCPQTAFRFPGFHPDVRRHEQGQTRRKVRRLLVPLFDNVTHLPLLRSPTTFVAQRQFSFLTLVFVVAAPSS